VLKAIDEGVRGIHMGIDRLNQAADRIAREGADGDMAGNFVQLLEARQAIRVNAASIRVADETFATLIDILA
jgi:hypothetical protein